MKSRLVAVTTLLTILSIPNFAEGANYEGRVGLRLNVGAMPFVRLSIHPESVSATVNTATNTATANTSGLLETHGGVALPIEAGLSYGITNALELGTSFVYSPTLGYYAGTKPYINQFAVGLSLRYFVNTNEPVRGYIAETVYLGFAPTTIQPKFDLGLQWDITDMVALYIENSLLPYVVVFGGPFEYNGAIEINAGIHLHF